MKIILLHLFSSGLCLAFESREMIDIQFDEKSLFFDASNKTVQHLRYFQSKKKKKNENLPILNFKFKKYYKFKI
jgi:hypothetical protein